MISTCKFIIHIFILLIKNSSLRGRKIGFVTEGFENCSEEVISIVKQSFKYFTSAGILIEEVSIPWHTDGRLIYNVSVAYTVSYCDGN